MASVPGFLTKTFEIFSNPEYSDCCGWGPNGETIVIRKIEAFSKNVLPNYFKHSNFQSFVRQLNMYDFHKTVQDPSHGEFQHISFRRDRPDLLVYIKRKAHNKIPSVDAPAVVIQKKSKSGGSKASLLNGLLTVPDGHQDFDIDDSGETLFDGPDSKFLFDALQPTHELATKGLNHNSHAAVAAYSHPSNSNSSGLGGQSGRLGNSLDPATMLEELVHQQAMQDSFEHRLRELEHQSGCVTSENAMLKRVVSEIGGRQAETQQRVDGLLKFIYSVFITNSDSLPNSIAQSAKTLFEDAKKLLQHTSQPLPVMNFPPHTQAPSKAIQNSLPIPNNMNRQPSFDLEPSISTSGSSSLPMGGPGTDTAAQRLTSFDHAASTVGRSWETSSPSLSSLAFASAHQRQAESRESLGPEEAEAAVTLQRMTTPDLYGMGDTAAKGIAESAETSSVGASTTGKNGQIAPAKGRLPPSSLGSAAIVITGGGELRRMASIFSTIDDNSLGFSRGNSMEAWTMYGPPQASSSSHSTMKRERERDFPGVDVDGMSDKKKQLSENPTNALRRIQSQQQASVARMDSLEQSLSLIDDIDWRDIISPRESVDNYRFVDESSHDNELANEVIKSEKI